MDIYFPHNKIRETQKELMEKIQETLEKNTNLIAHAPVGLGKTAAALSVTLSFALKNKLTVFFITPKHTQHRIAVETLKMIKQKYNLDFSVIDLIGKKWMCAQTGVTEMSTGEFYDYCKEMIENKQCVYYENIKKEDKISLETKETLKILNTKIMHVEEFKDYTKNKVLCPFEIACLVAKRASVIIADYHHILSQPVRENLLERINKDLSECIIIIDESHNLPSKCRELLSSQTSTTTIEFAIKEIESHGYKEIAETLREIKNKIENLARRKISKETNNEALIKKEELSNEIKSIINIDQLVDDLFFISAKTIEIKKRSSAKNIANFLINWDGPDKSFTRIIKIEKNNKGKEHVVVNYNCLDPSVITKIIASLSHNIICMSGTLTPLEMYKDLLGFDAISAEFSNPFPKNNKLSIIVPDTTTKFTARSPEMFENIAKHCSQIVNEVPGNSLIFFPSYDIRNKVYTYLEKLCKKTTFLETQNMSKQEKTELLEKFKSYNNIGAVLLGASSGNFGEGIDIENNILKCVIVVGIPLEKPNLETQELISYYDYKFGKGWDYGYIMPAIIKCLQNTGRCIRSETDKGIMIFLDQRYVWDSYFKCFPKDSNLRIAKEPLIKIKEFFNTTK